MKRSRTQSITLAGKIRQMFLPAGSEFILNDILNQDLSRADFPAKMYWLEQICHWLFRHQKSSYEARFRFFFQILEKNPEWKERFREIFSELMQRQDLLHLFVNTGHAVERGLWGDIARRIAERLFPLRTQYGFHEILLSVFNTVESIQGLRDLSDETLAELRSLLHDASVRPYWKELMKTRGEALHYLSVHVAHYGIGSGIRSRLGNGGLISQNPFFQLGQHFQSGLPADLDLIEKCESKIDAIYDGLETTGVSVDVVTRLETMDALLAQMRNVLKLGGNLSETESSRMFAILS